MERLGRSFSRISQRYLPDPLVLAILLTLLVMVVASAVPQSEPIRGAGALERLAGITGLWIQGITSTGFLAFALQMCLILLTGYGLAKAPVAARVLDALAGAARTNRGAVFLVALVSCVSCWINWGFGLIIAGLLAGQIRTRFARSRIPCRYPLIVASAYMGMMIWHGGLSGSAPLKVADGIDIERQVDGVSSTVRVEGITIHRTILSPINLVLTAVLFIAIPLVVRSMAGRPDSEDLPTLDDESPRAPPQLEEAGGSAVERTPAEMLNRSRWLRALVVTVALIALLARVREKQWGAVDLTFVNLLFLTLGLMLHRDIVSYMAAVAEGGRAIAGIVIQFPLYAGIQSIMAGAGLAAAVSHLFVNLSYWGTEVLGIEAGATFPVATFFSAALVNMFVPSGGGQWIVQGPIMCSAADQLQLPLAQTVMAVAYGDQLTNMVQPFWAIPLMGLTRVNARQFMGYCALLMLLAVPVFIAALLCF